MKTCLVLILGALTTVSVVAGTSDVPFDESMEAGLPEHGSTYELLWNLMVPHNQNEARNLALRATSISPNPPKFDTVQEYITFANQEKANTRQQCDQTGSPQDCYNCLAAAVGAWVGGLYLCLSESGAGPLGPAIGLVCSVGVTALYWQAKIKCLAI